MKTRLFRGGVFTLVGVLVLAAVFGSMIAPDTVYLSDIRNALKPPSAFHWWGTDDQGRDVLWRVVAGSRATLLSSALIVTLYSLIGVAIAVLAAIGPRWLDEVLMRITDIGLALPNIVVALGFAAALGPSLQSAIIAKVVTGWPLTARLLRAILRQTMTATFVVGAESVGGIALPSDGAPRAAQLVRYHDRQMGRRRQCHGAHPGRPVLHRRRRPTAQRGMGSDDRGRPRLHVDRLVGGGSAGFRHGAHVHRLRSARRHSPTEPRPGAGGKMNPLLEARGLTVDVGAVRIVDGLDFGIEAGERVALVGESGSGKSVTAHALLRLNPRARIGGRLRFDDQDLLAKSERQMNAVRGAGIGLAFQDAMASLDPIMTIGDQVAEALRIRGVSRATARRRTVALLEELGVANAGDRLGAYVHEFSGGQRQRIVLAMAMIAEPKLLIADEPTTALDVRVQEQLLDLLDEVTASRGLAVLLITHDLGIVASFAERVMVIYGGRLAEDGPVDSMFAQPRHPYTQALLAAVPRVDRTVEALAAIVGAPVGARARPSGCAFHTRCPHAIDLCRDTVPPLRTLGSHRVACHLVEAAHAA